MTRLRDLGIQIGQLNTGARNAITDVTGVKVGHATVISDEGKIARTGVTVIRPRSTYVRTDPLFAGSATLNGNGEMTGLEWIRESGLLTTDIGLTGTHSVGTVRDALVGIDTAHPDFKNIWSLPVVGETSDRAFNSGNAQFVTREHVQGAYDSASEDVKEGSVGGGTGMQCHGFKGGIGTSSRQLSETDGGWTVGVLVQANHGTREDFRVDGRPVGRHDLLASVPVSGRTQPSPQPYGPPGSGSIIVIVATDAPLLPDHCRRLAIRAGLGIARVGGVITVQFLDHGVDGQGPVTDKGRMDLEVIRLDPAKEVRWRVKAGPQEWIGTDVTFSLSPADGQTVILFGHRNWSEAVEFTAHCSMKWATFLLSLRELVETGSGRPSPDDLKIDNWN